MTSLRPVISLLLVPALLMVIPMVLHAQPADSNRVDTPRVEQGTIPLRPADSTVAPRTIPLNYVISKNPTMAMLYSIIPGGGQFYNEQYWKIPLVVLPAGYFVWRAIYYHGKFRTEADRAAAVGVDSPAYANLKFLREFYRDERDQAVSYYLLITALNMIDAYVGAHLFDFTSGAETSSRLYIRPDLTGVGVSVSW